MSDKTTTPVTKTGPTLDQLVTKTLKYSEKSMPSDNQVIRVLRQIESRENPDGSITDRAVAVRGKSTITPAQFKAMPLYYVRKHSLWHMVTNLSKSEIELLKSVPARRLLGYYTRR